jgi:hypothetical protein
MTETSELETEKIPATGYFDVQVFATVYVEDGVVKSMHVERGVDTDFAFLVALTNEAGDEFCTVSVEGSKGPSGEWTLGGEDQDGYPDDDVVDAVMGVLGATWTAETEVTSS